MDLQAAIADAGLGDERAAFERVDGLLARFERGDDSHPLALVLLHEARARFAAQFQRKAEFERSSQAAERWARRTGTPALIAKCERLADLQRTEVSIRAKQLPVTPLTTANDTTLLTLQQRTAAHRRKNSSN